MHDLDPSPLELYPWLCGHFDRRADGRVRDYPNTQPKFAFF